MKAPISKKVFTILSDKTSSKKLVDTAIVKQDSDQHEIVVGGKLYKLQRISNLINH